MENYGVNETVTISIERFNELVNIKQNFDAQIEKEQRKYKEKLVEKETEVLELFKEDYIYCADSYDFRRVSRRYSENIEIKGMIYKRVAAEDVGILCTPPTTNNWWKFWK